MEEPKKTENEDDKDESEQRVWSWGAGTEGQLGTKILQDEHFPQLLHQPSLSSISSLACGGAHVIALTSGINSIFSFFFVLFCFNFAIYVDVNIILKYCSWEGTIMG